ncbi:hypothetical protein FA13DRAFT_1728627 [Coprinellus micaceus]|uniref:Uncharacterized protein n=1 Tax=Coprinellus micaceus TaxID=71717 RepID=A0A4Y7TQB0_COPMI|nr:hypothetical protein FA13DRAFT_1728627 [Coprinellus micaceus]
MKIEWSNEFRSDGTMRRPPPNSLHGWLAKMRGTLLGDEALRSRGIREMADAKRYKEKRQQAAKSSTKPILGGMIYSAEPRPIPTRRSTQKSVQSQRLTKDKRSASYSTSRRPSHHSKSSSRPRTNQRSASSKSLPGARPTRTDSRPTPQRRETTRR